MKDAYSFDLDFEARAPPTTGCSSPTCGPSRGSGLKAIPMRADTGPIGGDLSHEFIILADTGESAVFCDKRCLDFDVPGADTDFATPTFRRSSTRWTSPYAATDEKHDEAAFEAMPEERRVAARGIEVGHIFYFGDQIFRPAGRPRHRSRRRRACRCTWAPMASAYRAWSAPIIEASHDDNGIIWPDSVAPFAVGLINLKPGDEATDEVAEGLYAGSKMPACRVLYDDLDQRAGAKFAAWT